MTAVAKPRTRRATLTPDTVEAADAQAKQDSLLGRVHQLQEAAVDLRGDTRALSAEVVGEGDAAAEIDRVRLRLHTPRGELVVAPNRLAHTQLAEKVGIPREYYDRMLGAAPALLAENVNRWLREPDTRLLRLMKPLAPADGQRLERMGAQLTLRGVLGAAYRPVDHAPILNTLAPLAAERGLLVHEYNLDDERLFVRWVQRESRDVAEVARAYRQAHPGVGDHDVSLHEFVRFGVSITNSEVGWSSFRVEAMVEFMRCVNLYVETKQRVRHVGGRAPVEEGIFAADTRRLDDAALVLKIRDHFLAILTEDQMRAAAARIAQAEGVAIPLPPEVPLFEFVDGFAGHHGLTEAETAVLKEEVLAERAVLAQRGAPKSDLTPFELAQGLTATARRMAGQNYTRKTELEALGWDVLGDTVSELLRAGGVGRN